MRSFVSLFLIGLFLLALANLCSCHPHDGTQLEGIEEEQKQEVEEKELTGDEECPEDERAKKQVFDSTALQHFNYCVELSDIDCRNIHEAERKCYCICQLRLKGINVNGRPAADVKKKKKKKTTNDDESDKDGDKLLCFPADGLVSTNRGQMEMQKLLHDDTVQLVVWDSEGQKFAHSPIEYWLHAEANKEAQFLSLSTQSGRLVTLTGNHVIYRSTDCDLGRVDTIEARFVAVGDCLLVQEEENSSKLVLSRVVQIEKRVKLGIYAPVSSQGNLLVQGVLTSCFANQDNQALQQFAHAFYRLQAKFWRPNLAQVAGGDGAVCIPRIFLAFEKLQKYLIW